MTALRDRLGAHGVFLGRLAQQPAADLRRDVTALERLGFGTVWIGEAFGREPFTTAAIVLAATERLVVATGIASIWSRDAVAMINAARTLAEAWPERFVLGIGVSHPPLVSPRGHLYGDPRSTMSHYLEEMRRARYEGPSPDPEPSVVLAALGPRMLQLAATQAEGAFTYFVPPEHTRGARTALGTGVLAVEQAVVMADTRTGARRQADRYVTTYLGLDNYRRNLLRLGYGAADVSDGGSDALFDALIAWGDDEGLRTRLRAHPAAGADHLAVQVVARDAPAGVMEGLRRVASLLDPG